MPGAQAAATCTPVATSRGAFTAALVNPPAVTGDVDATGCDIAVYYDGTSPGAINNADVHSALWYGVFDDGAAVSIANSHIHDIGDTPFNGVQRGIGVILDRGSQ